MAPTKFFASLGFSIARKIVLLVSFIAISLTALAYIFLVLEVHTYLQTALRQFYTIQLEQTANFFAENATIHKDYIERIQPYIGNTASGSTNTLLAIATRTIDTTENLSDITLYLPNGDKAFGLATKPDTSLVTLQLNNNYLESYTLWHTDPTYNLTIGSTFSVENFLETIAYNHSQSTVPYTTTLAFLETKPQQAVHIRNDELEPISQLQMYTEDKDSLQRNSTPASFYELLQATKIHVSSTALTPETVVQVSIPTAFIYQAPNELLRLAMISIALLIAVSIVIALGLTQAITAPISAIQSKLLAFKPSTIPYNLTVNKPNEIRALDQAIHQVTSKLTTLYTTLEAQVAEDSKRITQSLNTERALFDSINIGLAVVNMQGDLQEHNKALEKILQKEFIAPLRTTIYELLPLFKKQIAVPIEEHPVTKCLQQGTEMRVQPDEHVAVRVQETYVPLRLVISPIVSNTAVQGAVIIVQDATHEYKVERLKNEFIELASHQLRTPLASVQWYSELLPQKDAENFTNQQRQFVVELRLATQRLGNVINELMDASRLHDGVIEKRPEEFDIVKLSQGIIDDVAQTAKRKEISIVLFTVQSSIRLTSDPILLGIVLQNLLMNAVKYSTNHSEVRVRIEENSTSVTLNVSDEGIGIPQSDQDRIFHKLFRAANARKMDTDGSGLGLYSSRKILTQLSGKITFSSIEGKGSTFSVIIPK